MSSTSICPAGTTAAPSAYPCRDCGRPFTLAAETLELFPGWLPQRCLACLGQKKPSTPLVTPGEALTSYSEGPDSGIFVHGSCEPNPGSGAWAAVRVVSGAVLTETTDREPATTSSRMELVAVIQGLRLALPRERVSLYTNSEVAAATLRDWAPAWQRNGWRRGPRRERIANLDLVQEAFAAYQGRPNAEVLWLKAADARWIHYSRAVSRAQLFEAA